MKSAPVDKKRLMVLQIFLLFIFCLLIVQFYKIQIIEGEKWEKDAFSQHQTILIDSFMRGSFYSNTAVKAGHPEKEQPFVMDVLKFHFHIYQSS